MCSIRTCYCQTWHMTVSIKHHASPAVDLSLRLLASLWYNFSKRTPSMPKHGKMDPKNAPHAGGNTWAGGTGGIFLPPLCMCVCVWSVP